ncbi:MAG TPA: hypothetical protein VES39_03490 [Rhodospirillales bacterium]|nr:hypothetical protein [Rhodospirillales bacterium]
MQILTLLVGAASTLMVLVETMEMTMTTKRTDNSNALDAFIVRKREIDAMLQRLTAFSDDHFGVAPDEVNWGHVGNLGYVVERLREASDFLFTDGECAA